MLPGPTAATQTDSKAASSPHKRKCFDAVANIETSRFASKKAVGEEKLFSKMNGIVRKHLLALRKRAVKMVVEKQVN